MKKIVILVGLVVVTVLSAVICVSVSNSAPTTEAFFDTISTDDVESGTASVTTTTPTTTVTTATTTKVTYEPVYYVYKPDTHYVHLSTCEWASNGDKVFKIETTKGLETRHCEDCEPSIKIHDEYVVETEPVVTTTKTSSTVTSAATVEEKTEEAPKQNNYVSADSGWSGQRLTRNAGKIQGPSGTETYYNLDMSGIVSVMRGLGYDAENYPYWVREDGAKMLGPYVMVAANLSIRPRGIILPCSLGTAIVCDTGGFVNWDSTRLDLACQW